MLNLQKYKDNRGKIQLHPFVIRNMLNYVRLLGYKNYEFFDNNGIINIYLPNAIVITYYSTKDFANVYSRHHVICKIQNWVNVLRYLRAMRGK